MMPIKDIINRLTPDESISELDEHLYTMAPKSWLRRRLGQALWRKHSVMQTETSKKLQLYTFGTE